MTPQTSTRAVNKTKLDALRARLPSRGAGRAQAGLKDGAGGAKENEKERDPHSDHEKEPAADRAPESGLEAAERALEASTSGAASLWDDERTVGELVRLAKGLGGDPMAGRTSEGVRSLVALRGMLAGAGGAPAAVGEVAEAAAGAAQAALRAGGKSCWAVLSAALRCMAAVDSAVFSSGMEWRRCLVSGPGFLDIYADALALASTGGEGAAESAAAGAEGLQVRATGSSAAESELGNVMCDLMG